MQRQSKMQRVAIRRIKELLKSKSALKITSSVVMLPETWNISKLYWATWIECIRLVFHNCVLSCPSTWSLCMGVTDLLWNVTLQSIQICFPGNTDHTLGMIVTKTLWRFGNVILAKVLLSWGYFSSTIMFYSNHIIFYKFGKYSKTVNTKIFLYL